MTREIGREREREGGEIMTREREGEREGRDYDKRERGGRERL